MLLLSKGIKILKLRDWFQGFRGFRGLGRARRWERLVILPRRTTHRGDQAVSQELDGVQGGCCCRACAAVTHPR